MATSLTTSTASLATATPLGKPILEPSPNFLPDWPPILAIFLLSWLVTAWVVTVVLFLALFPEKVAWLDRWIDKWRLWVRRDRPALPRTATSLPNSVTFPIWKNTSVNREDRSTAVTTGLGISLGSLTPRLQRPRSFDEESLHPRHWSLESGASALSTAPLLSSRSFVDWTPEPDKRQRGGVGRWERGLVVNQENGEGESEADDPDALPEFRNESRPGTSGTAGVLESVQAAVEFIAGWLAKMGHDEVVDGAEAGLLIPVGDRERQTAVDLCGGC